MTRRQSSMMILKDAQDHAETIKPPPMFQKSIVYLDDFDNTHMGAKSNNLRILKEKMNEDIKLPQSCTIPYQVLEYTLKQQPVIEKKINQLIERINTVKSVKKMNKMLYKCKEMVQSIKFMESDQHHKYIKEQLLLFGIPENQFAQAWETIKRVWASKFNERAFLAVKKIGLSLY